MVPHPSILLVLVLCLGPAIHMQNRVLPKPSIRAQPDSVIHRGRPVTIVCRGPAWAELFRLQDRRSGDWYDRKVSQRGSHWTEATFHADAVSELTAGSYFCRYLNRQTWSQPSEILELKVIGVPRVVYSTPVTHTKPPSPAESSTSRAALQETGHKQTNSPDTKTSKHLYILVGIGVASLLCLLLLILLLVHRQHQKKRGPPSSKGEEPRPQERLSPTVDITLSPADVATTVDTLPEENGEMHSQSPAAEDLQEVAYAQLDQRALTWRAARAEPQQPMEPTPESSMYAALPRH